MLEGAITGVIGSACGLLIANPFTAVACAIVGGALTDMGVQATSHYTKNDNMDDFHLNVGRTAKTAIQTGLGTAVPAFKNAKTVGVDAIGTALAWAEASFIIASTDVIFTNTRNAIKSNRLKKNVVLRKYKRSQNVSLRKYKCSTSA